MRIKIVNIALVPSVSVDVLSVAMLNEGRASFLTCADYAELRMPTGELIVRATVHGVWGLNSRSAPWGVFGDAASYFCAIDGFPQCRLHRCTPGVPYNLYTAPGRRNVFEIAEQMQAPVLDDLCSPYSSEVDCSEGDSSREVCSSSGSFDKTVLSEVAELIAGTPENCAWI
jgi:hypothetical protein